MNNIKIKNASLLLKNIDGLYDITIGEGRGFDENYPFVLGLAVLPAYFRHNVKFTIQSDGFQERLPPRVFMTDRASKYTSFFFVNNNLFMIIACDDPTINHELWIDHYINSGVKAFFVLQNRRSTQFIFKNCKIPVYPLPGKLGMAFAEFEYFVHQMSMTSQKDIPVFFCGRYRNNFWRYSIVEKIQQNFPDAFLFNKRKGRTISDDEYLDKLCRSKIAWCPKSVVAKPDSEANGFTARECEAMCAQVLVLRNSNNLIESEERISGIHYVETTNEKNDVINKIKYYLEHDDERETIAYNGRLWYERNCTSFARSIYILNCCIKTLKNEQNNTA